MAEIYKPKTTDQIYNAMKQYLIGKSSTLVNFNAGARLPVLLEAISLVDAQTQNDFFQALKSAIPVAIYNGFDFDKKDGIFASGKLTFSRNQNALQDYVIPIGTAILLDGIQFTTIEVGQISTGTKISGQITAEASVVGDDGNIDASAIDTLSGLGSFVNQPTGVESSTNPVAFTGGEEPESDEARASRFREFVQSLAKSTVSGFKSGTLLIDGIKGVTVAENTPSDGIVTVYADDGTGTLSAAKQAEIEKILNGDATDYKNYPGYRAAGISVVVTAPVLSLINITGGLTVYNSSDLTNTELETLATTAMQNYVNTLSLGDDFVLSEVVTAVQGAHPDIYDYVISVPAANVAVAAGELAKTDTITYSPATVRI